MTLRTGIVGAGIVSHNNHLPAVARNPRTTLAAVCDTDRERAGSATGTYGGRPYAEIETMLANEPLDWVHVATPVGTHFPLVESTIEADIPTTVQKPATVTLDELEALLARADERDVPVSVVHNWLYYPVMRRVRRRLDRGTLGRIHAVETTFTGEGPPDETYRGDWVFDLPGGEFEEGLAHPLYLTAEIGGIPRSLDAVDIHTHCYGDYDEGFTYDGVTLQYESEAGALCQVAVLAGSARGQVLRVHGEAGSLTVDLASRTVRAYDPETGPFHFFAERLKRGVADVGTDYAGLLSNLSIRAKELYEDRFDRHLADSPDGHYALLDAVARALDRGEPPPVPLERSRWTVGSMERIRASPSHEGVDHRVPSP